MPVARENVRSLNRQRAHFADRYLFADRRDEGLRRLGEKFPEKGHQLKIQVR
jgi:hypothetical protein